MIFSNKMKKNNRLPSIILCLIIPCFLTAKSNGKDIKVACIGNSITYGIGVENRDRESYPAQLQNLLGNGYQVKNFGHPGATLLSRGHHPYNKLSEFEKAKIFKPDIAVFHLGINDTDPRNWPNYSDDFVTDYVSLINSFRAINPKIRCIIALMTPIADRHPRFISGTSQWHEQIQEAIQNVSKATNAELIDFHTPLYPYPQLLPDAIHPDAEGALILAKTVYSAVTGNYGGLHVSELFTDNMVLQRNQHLVIRGMADTNTKVTVKLGKQKQQTISNKQGKWEVILDPIPAGEGYQLEIYTKDEKRIFRNVAIGEVWLCSGQSNMEFTLKQSTKSNTYISTATNKSIRLFDKKARWRTNNVTWASTAIDSINHLLYYKEAEWRECSPQTAANFSAIAYHFGRILQDSLKVPIGLICNAIGGSTTESWIDRHSLEMEFPAILKDWSNNDYIQEWARNRAKVNLKHSNSKIKRHPYEPCYLFESGILPMEKYPIKGIIWYQGESNAHNIEAHEKLFHLLVASWRGYWHNENLPFYFVQLSSLNRPSWPKFRDSQRLLMNSIENIGMVVSSDHGDSLDVHPRNKLPIGERLARWALAKDYHYPLNPSGPIFESASAKGNQVEISFKYSEGLQSSNHPMPIQGFELATIEGIYYPATAKVKGDKLLLTSPNVKEPHFVRYAWEPFTKANLVNKDQLPASTFKAKINIQKTKISDK